MTRFKNKSMQKMYDTARTCAADKSSEFWTRDGRRRTGANVRNAYWHGLDGMPCRYERDSLAYACWAAGRDDRRSKST